MTGFLLAGRALSDYRECGHAIPMGVRIERCMFCRERVTVPPDGAARLSEAQERGDSPCGVVCTPCALTAALGEALGAEEVSVKP